MATLTDPERLRHYPTAWRNWQYTGYVNWVAGPASQWIQRNLPGFTLREVTRLISEYVVTGGKIDEVRETRPEWMEHEYHYDLRLQIHGRPVYVETRLLMESDPEDSTILVVNIHEP